MSVRFAACLVLAALASPARAAQFTRLRPPDVKFVATPQSVVDAMLELARVTSADVVYDLGSGDGRIPITAAKKYGARGVGIEIDMFYLREAGQLERWGTTRFRYHLRFRAGARLVGRSLRSLTGGV